MDRPRCCVVATLINLTCALSASVSALPFALGRASISGTNPLPTTTFATPPVQQASFLAPRSGRRHFGLAAADGSDDANDEFSWLKSRLNINANARAKDTVDKTIKKSGLDDKRLKSRLNNNARAKDTTLVDEKIRRSLEGLEEKRGFFPLAGAGRARIWEDEMSPVVASLSGMVNVEALAALVNSNQTGTSLNKDDVDSSGTSFLNGGALVFDDFIRNLIPSDSTSETANITIDDLTNFSENQVARQETILPSSLVKSDRNVDAERILQDATRRLETMLNETSSALSPINIQSIFEQAGNVLDVERASKSTADLVSFGNKVLYEGLESLFLPKYASIKQINSDEQQLKIAKPSEFAVLAGAVYEDPVENSQSVNHSFVARGKAADVAWMVTDSVQDESDFLLDVKSRPVLVRTVAIRGYDASDEDVDRVRLLNMICTANSTTLGPLRVHEGMFSIARELLADIRPYIDWTSPNHKLVFTGHSIGGALSILLMAMLTVERGVKFVQKRVLRVYSFGSPPIFEHPEDIASTYSNCAILSSLGLENDIVYAYNQPWDPIVRLFTKIDPLYPLIDDIGDDGVTPWVNGPTRTLRPIVKAVLESWEDWPSYRDNVRYSLGQNYQHVGTHFILFPEPLRFLTDKLISANTAVPEIDSMVEISSMEILPALDEIFTLDVFLISYVAVAIRSFIHHFYPAYVGPFVEFAKEVQPRQVER